MRLQGQVAFITGANLGVDRAIAYEGARIVTTGRLMLSLI